MITKILAPAFLAAAAAAIALAPAASANTANCTDGGGASVCTRDGHAAITAKPADRVSNMSQWGLGSGPMPPVWAMD